MRILYLCFLFGDGLGEILNDVRCCCCSSVQSGEKGVGVVEKKSGVVSGEIIVEMSGEKIVGVSGKKRMEW